MKLLKCGISELRYYIAFISIIGLAFYLRPGDYNIWIDETFPFRFAKIFQEYGIIEGMKQTGGQEIVLNIIYYLLNITDPYEIRIIFKISGVLLVACVPLVIKDKKIALAVMFFFAFTPLLVYWSQFARPYIVAALFVLLSWKYPPFIILAVFTNPMAIIGANLYKRKWWLFYVIVFITAYLFFNAQPLPHDRLFTIDFFTQARRIYVIPYVTIMLYISNIPDSWIQRIEFFTKRLVTHSET